MRKTGKYETLGNIKFFIPDPLPPQNPPFEMSAQLTELYGKTMLSIGQLNEISDRLPSIDHFIRAYVYKEALLSSAIEGIHTTLLDVFTQPLVKTKANKETQLVINYTKALKKSLKMVQEDNFPIIERVILGAHKELMSGGEGDQSSPGAYRKQMVKVGNLVPPAPNKISKLMSDLEKFINTDKAILPIIRAGLTHVQFETIHPFLDGNGRIGRLLIVLMLIESGILKKPIIYPSCYFKKRHFDYYRLLDGVRTNSDFESWIKYYLTVIMDSAIDASKRAKEIENLIKEMKKKIAQKEKSGATNETKLQAIDVLFGYPIISIKKLSSKLKVSYNTASSIISDFIEHGFLVEENKKKRNRLFKFKKYFEVLEKEYE